eukprot:gene8362-9048_t
MNHCKDSLRLLLLMWFHMLGYILFLFLVSSVRLTALNQLNQYYTKNYIGSYTSPENSQLTETFIAKPAGLWGNGDDGQLYFADWGNCQIRKAGILTGGNTRVTTIVGTGICGHNGDNLPALQTDLLHPFFIFGDTVSRIYFSEENGLIRKYDPSTGLVATIFGNLNTAGCFEGDEATNCAVEPIISFWIDSDGNLYVVDIGSQRVLQVDASTKIVSLFTSSVENLIAIVGDYNNLYILDGGKVLSVSLTDSSSIDLLNENLGICNSLWVTTSANIYVTCPADQVVCYLDSSDYFSNPVFVGQLGSAGYSGDGGLAVYAKLNSPSAIFVDPNSGFIFISDSDNRVIRKINTALYISTGIGVNDGLCSVGSGCDRSSALISYPFGIWYNSLGTMYFTEFARNLVRKVDSGNDRITTVGTPIVTPQAISGDQYGNLYISTLTDNAIYRINNVTNLVSRLAGTGAEDSCASGNSPQLLSTVLCQPLGLYVDTNLRIYFAEYLNNRVRYILGNFIYIFAGTSVQGYFGDGMPATSAKLTAPTDVWGDSTGQLFIADNGNNRIRVVRNNIIFTIAGQSNPATIAGVLSNSAEFGSITSGISTYVPLASASNGLAVGADGSIYLSEYSGNLIRRISSYIAPTSYPSNSPSAQPSRQPSSQPSTQPSSQPSKGPSTKPTSSPSRKPSSQPSLQPTSKPTIRPTGQPSTQPSGQPMSNPSSKPSGKPSVEPSARPSAQPSGRPSVGPSGRPSGQPSGRPSVGPSGRPSSQPSGRPSVGPSERPSGQPSGRPSVGPSGRPSGQPSGRPSVGPSERPSGQPSIRPSVGPNGRPYNLPTKSPFISMNPTLFPRSGNTSSPSISSTLEAATNRPSSLATATPSLISSRSNTWLPTQTCSHLRIPTLAPSSLSGYPSVIFPTHIPISPTAVPSTRPSFIVPSVRPTVQISDLSLSPTVLTDTAVLSIEATVPMRQSLLLLGRLLLSPSIVPSVLRKVDLLSDGSVSIVFGGSASSLRDVVNVEVSVEGDSGVLTYVGGGGVGEEGEVPRVATSRPSKLPSSSPSMREETMSSRPSCSPTLFPTHPTESLSEAPSGPSQSPSCQPSTPTAVPSLLPSCSPSMSSAPKTKPSMRPSVAPSIVVTEQRSGVPSTAPTFVRTGKPSTRRPSIKPSLSPTKKPTHEPSRSTGHPTVSESVNITVIVEGGKYEGGVESHNLFILQPVALSRVEIEGGGQMNTYRIRSEGVRDVIV